MWIKVAFIMATAIIGYGLLLTMHWQLALGVFFIHWHINLSRTFLDKK